jgi:hypothetical protein
MGRLRLLAAIAVGLAFPAVFAPPVSASCAGPQAPDAFLSPAPGEFYDTVFIGAVTRIGPSVERHATAGDGGVYGGAPVRTPVDLEVQSVLAGSAARGVTVMNPGGTLHGLAYEIEDVPTFHVHERWLVVARRNTDGTYQTSACVGTRLLSPDDVALYASKGHVPDSVVISPNRSSTTSGSHPSGAETPLWPWVAAGAGALSILAAALFARRLRRTTARSRADAH